ncbi:signal recognition particle-docking protein FtsY [Candidatus Dependentiae bacterium]|nr:signal recognition particle-docking protein FtsY [Candidatus Dependentiae bacterium]
MFSFITQKLSAVVAQLTGAMRAIFQRSSIDDTALQEFKEALLQADVGVVTTNRLLAHIAAMMQQQQTMSGTALAGVVRDYLTQVLTTVSYAGEERIIVLVGINGAGKTTTAAKLAAHYQRQHERVLLVAADTFRAGAVDQLVAWAERLQCPIVAGKQGQDPAAVVYQGIAQYLHGNFDRVIIDTAGRLQTKTHLMQELTKVRSVITKQISDATITTLLTIDATIGQNSIQQAELFHQATPLQGVILTKLDSQAKGGIIFAIVQQLQLPIAYITTGQTVDDLAPFNPHDFINILL